jgi:hypothetical protein
VTGRDLITLDPAPREVALPDHLTQAMKAYKARALAERTRHAYARAWMQFEVWCQEHGRQALPATPETVGGWMTALAEAGKSRATISLYLSAVVVAQRHVDKSFDRKAPGHRRDLARHLQRQGDKRSRAPGQARGPAPSPYRLRLPPG